MSSEARQLEIFGEKLYFETNTDRVDSNGPAAYVLASQPSDKVKYNQSLHEGSGDSRIYAEKRLQIESGVKSQILSLDTIPFTYETKYYYCYVIYSSCSTLSISSIAYLKGDRDWDN